MHLASEITGWLSSRFPTFSFSEYKKYILKIEMPPTIIPARVVVGFELLEMDRSAPTISPAVRIYKAVPVIFRAVISNPSLALMLFLFMR